MFTADRIIIALPTMLGPRYVAYSPRDNTARLSPTLPGYRLTLNPREALGLSSEAEAATLAALAVPELAPRMIFASLGATVAAMTAAQRFCSETDTKLADYGAVQTVACDDSAEALFPDGSVASMLEGEPWEPRALPSRITARARA